LSILSLTEHLRMVWLPHGLVFRTRFYLRF